MRYAQLGKTGFQVGRVAFGGIVNMDETPQASVRFVGEAVERGVNYFDVAPSYGNAEERLGPAIEPYRGRVYLACKTARRDAEGAKRECLESLAKLRTDHFDVYQLHAMTTLEDVERAFGPGGAMETLLWAKREGLCRCLGFTAHSEEISLMCLERYAFDSVLFPMNWAMGMSVGWGDRLSRKAAESGAGLLAMKTLVHRKWREGEDGDWPKSWCRPLWGRPDLMRAAMKYGLAKGAATLIPPGNALHLGFMLDNIDRCCDEPMSDEEWDLLRWEAALVKNEMIFEP